jgi:insulysin
VQYYGTEYDTCPLDIDSLKAPLLSPANLALPEPNIFIPSSLELVTKEPVKKARLPEHSTRCILTLSASTQPFLRPTLARKTSSARLWVKTDDQWCVPRGTVYLLLRSCVFLLFSLTFPHTLPSSLPNLTSPLLRDKRSTVLMYC